MRLDVAVAQKCSVSRNRAHFFIEHELVLVHGNMVTKPSFEVENPNCLEILENPQIGYVSRSAQKLADFLDSNRIMVEGRNCLDIGASTGGFTQVLLERGAQSVVALDIGTSQLHERLRGNTRIESIEQTDIRTWSRKDRYDTIVIDVSFISVREILRHAMERLQKHGVCVVLFKPQFEVGASSLRKTGVPKTEKIRLEALGQFRKWLVGEGWKVRSERESTLSGELGNREVLFWLEA